MVSKYDVRKYFKDKTKENSNFYLVGDNFYSNESGEEVFICTIDKYLSYLRKKLHCNFETIYYDRVSLDHVIKCCDCGAIIFTGDDERYDPDLSCPCCGNYTGVDFWTKDEVEQSTEKQEALKFYEKIEKDKVERYEREKRRGGKLDHELLKKEFKGKSKYVKITLENMGLYGIDSPLKGLNIFIASGKKEDDFGYTIRKYTRIPLTPYAFYIQYIIPHTAHYKELQNKWST